MRSADNRTTIEAVLLDQLNQTHTTGLQITEFQLQASPAISKPPGLVTRLDSHLMK